MDPQLAADAEALLDRLDHDVDQRRIQVGHGRKDDVNDYCILQHIPIDVKKGFVERAISDNFLNRVMGSMVGMAVGDGLGHPFEFLPAADTVREDSPHFDLATMKFINESNCFGLARGQWTDDASMGLCMADSIIMRRGYDGSDMRIRFWCWWNRGYNNAFRKDRSRSGSVGLGGNIAKSLIAITMSPGSITPVYEAAGEDAGNGSLMRFTPISLYMHSATMDEVYECARASSYTTHPGIIAAEACSLLAHLIVKALKLPAGPVDPKAFLEEETRSYLEVSGLNAKSGWGYDEMKWLVLGAPARDTERCWAWREESLDIAGTLKARGNSYNGYPVSSGYFGSYSLDGLAMAMWSVYHTTSFDEAVVRSVNLLGDADSHGSITGQLAGALYGYSSINRQFVEWLTQWDDYEFAVRGILLAYLGNARTSTESSMTTSSATCQTGPSVTRATSGNNTTSVAPPLGRVISGPATNSWDSVTKRESASSMR